MTPQEAIEFINARKISIQKWSNNEQLAINMAIESLEKQIPEKPNDYYGFYHCPACEHSLVEYKWSGGIHYCHYCGQAIDWGDTE